MNTTSAAAPAAFNNMSSSSYSKKLMTTSIGGLSAVSELESMDPNPFPLVPFQVCSIHYFYYLQNFMRSFSRNFFVKILFFSVSTNWESVIVIFDSSTTNLSWMRFWKSVIIQSRKLPKMLLRPLLLRQIVKSHLLSNFKIVFIKMNKQVRLKKWNENDICT